jgi:hypothetical protein
MKPKLPIAPLVAGLLLFAAIPPVLAADAAPASEEVAPQPIAWATLDSAQQALLAPLVEQWDSLPANQQRHFARLAARAPQWTDQRRETFQRRVERWSIMTPEQRVATLERYREFRNLPKSEQQRLRHTYQRYNDLTPEQREQLRERYRELKSGQG